MQVAALNPLDAQSLLASLGALGVFLALFAETGLLIGFFLPGDSLLFTAGLLCTTSATAKVHLSLPTVLVAAAAGALLGPQVGYLIGRGAGPALLDRPERRRMQMAVTGRGRLLDRYGHAQGDRAGPLHPARPHRAQPHGRSDRRAGTGSFTLWQVVGGVLWAVGRDRGRLRARHADPERRQVPAADHRRHRASCR